MGEEGSKAMTIYIVACFLLAMVALVGYKFANEKRLELSGEYVQLSQSVADVQAAFAPNINDYYRKVKDGDIKPIDKAARDNTHVRLGEIADKLNIKSGAGTDDHLDMGTPTSKTVVLRHRWSWIARPPHASESAPHCSTIRSMMPLASARCPPFIHH